jgi:peroxiredoxin/mono/diheme cytochrome c family protein
MRLRISFIAVLATVAMTYLYFADRTAANDPSTANLGKKIGNITFKNASGKTSTLYDLKNKKAIVIVFLSFECPVSNSYSQPLSNMATEFAKQGIAFIGLTTNQDDTPADVAKHAKEHDLKFPVFHDTGFTAAGALKADVTPEAFVLNGDHVMMYRGRIDNSYYARLKKNQQITKHDLRQVLGEILSGRPISNPATEAVGCAIPRDNKSAVKAGEVTYHRDVLPILQQNCQSCHRPGEVGPFSLMTYRQAVNWATDIKEYTQKRVMPPWKPSAGFAFHNERKLSDKEIATLAAWADNNTPEGDVKDAPPPVKFTSGWTLGQPDLVLTVGDDYQLGPTGSDVFRCFVLPTNLTEDKHVAAVEVRPGNPRVVHHALCFIDTNGQGRKLEEQAKAKGKDQEKKANDDPKHRPSELDRGPGYSMAMGVGFLPRGALGGWVPGQIGRYLPEGTGIELPKGSDVVMQLHYHRNGRLEKDRTSIGIYFAKKKVDKVFQGGVIPGLFFGIPAGAERHPVKGSTWATGDLTLHSIMPHMHMIGKEITVTMTPPEGAKQTLLAIKEWDYNWQETYLFKEPVQIKSGTRFDVEAVYDNSAKNRNNPFDPPRLITFGEQTTNEMCFVFLGGTSSGWRQQLPLTRTAPKDQK